MSKHYIPFFIFFLFSTIIKSETLDKTQLYFEPAQTGERKFLINFAIDSNDIYKTRVVEKEKGEEVLDIPESTFENGIVEVLKSNNDEIVGFFTLKIDKTQVDKKAELGHLFVKAGLQHNGLGSILFDQAISHAKERGYKELWWISDPDAEKFYLKKGAKIVRYEENLLNPATALPIFEYEL